MFIKKETIKSKEGGTIRQNGVMENVILK